MPPELLAAYGNQKKATNPDDKYEAFVQTEIAKNAYLTPATKADYIERARKEIANNGHFNMVQRIKNFNPATTLNIPTPAPYDEGIPGQYSSHLMAWGSKENANGNKYPIVYPTIVQRKGENKLTHFPNQDDAYNHAMQTGEYFQFQPGEEGLADWFSTNGYKHGAGFTENSNGEMIPPRPQPAFPPQLQSAANFLNKRTY